MLRTSYNHLNTVQKGSLGEAFSKMAFTLEGFEVYDAEYDDRGIDFVVRNSSGQFLSVQVKATDKSVNPFIKEDKFCQDDDFIFCAVRLIEGEPPALFLARGSDWQNLSFLDGTDRSWTEWPRTPKSHCHTLAWLEHSWMMSGPSEQIM